MPVDDLYTLTTSSTVDIYGCLHNGSFSLEAPNQNLLACDYDSAGGGSFQINAYLQSDVTYVIMVTSFEEDTVGEYMLSVCGPHKANLIPTRNTTIAINTTVTSTGE